MRPITVALMLFLALVPIPRAAADAKDAPIILTLDGRPMSKKPEVAMMHDGVLFVDAVDLTRVFDGLLVFERKGVRLTVHGYTAAFHLGERVAQIDRAPVRLPAAPFEYAGDIYVPLTTFLSVDKSLVLVWVNRRHADLHVTAFPKAT